jgi:hypothetical protein
MEVRASQSISSIPTLWPCRLDQAAQARGASKGTLARRMQSVSGKTAIPLLPGRVGIEHAMPLPRTSQASAGQSGARGVGSARLCEGCCGAGSAAARIAP